EPASPACTGALAVKLPWIRLGLAVGLAFLDVCRSSTHLGAVPICRSAIHTEAPSEPFRMFRPATRGVSTSDTGACLLRRPRSGGGYRRTVRHPIFPSLGLADGSHTGIR